MRYIFLLLLFNFTTALILQAQSINPNEKQKAEFSVLIQNYSIAREKKDTVLLKRILTADVDQLVSTGEWRTGIDAAVQGMLQSSINSPGTRTLSIEKTKVLNSNCAVVDCRYEIENRDGSIRKMWSTFIVVANEGTWKIAAIRNMLPEVH